MESNSIRLRHWSEDFFRLIRLFREETLGAREEGNDAGAMARALGLATTNGTMFESNHLPYTIAPKWGKANRALILAHPLRWTACVSGRTKDKPTARTERKQKYSDTQ